MDGSNIPNNEQLEPGMYTIEINDSQDHLTIDESLIRNVIETTLSVERVARAAISVALVDNAKIHELNRQFLNHDYETDVLSFLLECEKHETRSEDEDSQYPGAGLHIEGELIISTEMAAQRAADYHWSFGDELVLYLVHGLLHLVGYDDQTEDQREQMRARERAILSHWNLTPHYTQPESSMASERLEISGDGLSFLPEQQRGANS
ncbi:MAG: hypothetical protein Tsb009_04910 [Planctomycetaceae bacterium]